MRIFEVIGIGVLILLVGLLLIFVRREVISRARRHDRHEHAAVDLRARSRAGPPALGRFAGDELRWYRMFSFGLRPTPGAVRGTASWSRPRRSPGGRGAAGHARGLGHRPVHGQRAGPAGIVPGGVALAESPWPVSCSWRSSRRRRSRAQQLLVAGWMSAPATGLQAAD